MRKLFAALVALLLFTTYNANAQVGIGTPTPDTSSILELKDTARGLLIPRMTSANKNAIVAPATGLTIYQTDSTAGYWYYDGALWRNLNGLQNGGGKQTILLTDLITDAQAQAKIAAEVGPYTQEIKIIGCSNLTTVDLSMISEAISINIADDTLLQTVNLSGLVTCAGNLIFRNCPVLSSINLSSLQTVITSDADAMGFNISNTGLGSFTLPSLIRFQGLMNVSNNNHMTTLSFPNLTTTGLSNNIQVSNNSLLTQVLMPLLSRAAYLSIYSNPVLTKLNFAGLTTISQNLTIEANPKITTATFEGLSSAYQVYIISNNIMTTASFPVLTSVPGIFECTQNNAITNVSLPILLTAGAVYFQQDTTLTTVSLPNLKNITDNTTGSVINQCIHLTNISFDRLTVFKNQEFDCNNSALTQQTIDYLLTKFYQISPPLTTDIFSMNGQTPAAPPSGVAITYKTILIQRGNFVVTD